MKNRSGEPQQPHPEELHHAYRIISLSWFQGRVVSVTSMHKSGICDQRRQVKLSEGGGVTGNVGRHREKRGVTPPPKTTAHYVKGLK